MTAPKPISGSRDELKLLETIPDQVTFYACQNLMVSIWHNRTAASSLHRMVLLTNRLRAEYPTGGSAICIVRSSVSLPDAGTRNALVAVANENAGWFAAVGVVFGGTGFWASTMRSVITALRVVASRDYELRMHATVDEALSWLPDVHLARTGVALSADALRPQLRRIATE